MKALGIDLSTQSCTLCLLDGASGHSETVSQAYGALPGIKNSPMDELSLLVLAPKGCAEQDPRIFLEALEVCLIKLKNGLPSVSAVQISAQQHGHVYLKSSFARAVESLPLGKSLTQALAHPQSQAGSIVPYFQKTYGFSSNCIVGIGTGDNPATKVLGPRDILSLGPSFVYMKNTAIEARDETSIANAMYDGLGNPYTIFCRTNGALVWDKIRAVHGADISKAGAALATGEFPLCLWHPEAESVPISPAFRLKRFHTASLAEDYWGLVLSSLTLLHGHTERSGSPKSLAVTGVASADKEILALAAHIWECPVTVLPRGGAALAALALANPSTDLDGLRQTLAEGQALLPDSARYGAFRYYKKEILNRFSEIAHA